MCHNACAWDVSAEAAGSHSWQYGRRYGRRYGQGYDQGYKDRYGSAGYGQRSRTSFLAVPHQMKER
jgi:hypothetical protein